MATEFWMVKNKSVCLENYCAIYAKLSPSAGSQTLRRHKF